MTPAEEIRLVQETKAAALVARKSDELAALIHSDFVYINASGRSFDKTNYIDAYCTSGRIVFIEQRFSNLEVKRIDDFAIATVSINDELRIGERAVSGPPAARARPLIIPWRAREPKPHAAARSNCRRSQRPLVTDQGFGIDDIICG